MHNRSTLIALCFTALALCACGKTPPDMPPLKQAPADAASTPASAADMSVPTASSVFTPASKAKSPPATGSASSSISPAQQSNAMPMPGQNNDHSAPVRPNAPASSP